MLKAISPIDGRYAGKTAELAEFFSEFALIRYRVFVEIQYFTALCHLPLPQLKDIPEDKLRQLERVINQFSESDAQEIKDIEKTTNHDVKAVEYFLKKHFDALGLEAYKEFVHFGLTSQDINNTSTPLMLKQGLDMVLLPELNVLISELSELVESWKAQPMLARTHGQPASPTLLGKEFQVFVVRLEEQIKQLSQISHRAKFGGATGNMNAHYAAYPAIDWHGFAQGFVQNYLGMERSFPTTQIEHYDNLAAVFHALARINTILLDLAKDVWTYISMDYFKQKTVKGEIGSSAMPHKVNPIDFENAEGNLGIANAFYEHLAAKLPVSRLQRDLTDSTVLRNIGVPFGHSLIAFKAIRKGLSKLLLNKAKIDADLEANWAVVAEAIQNVLRREGYPNPYEALLNLTRGKTGIDHAAIKSFIDSLEVTDAVRAELHAFSPANYVGRFE